MSEEQAQLLQVIDQLKMQNQEQALTINNLHYDLEKE